MQNQLGLVIKTTAVQDSWSVKGLTKIFFYDIFKDNTCSEENMTIIKIILLMFIQHEGATKW